jgi:Methyltransferase domain
MYRFWNHIVSPLLDASHARSVLEIGSGSGDHTRLLHEYCKPRGILLTVIDPEPSWDLVAWQREHADVVRLESSPSLDVLSSLGHHNAVLIDGDHNWYTVINELRTLAVTAKSAGKPFPLTILHDTGWPYGRRDMYHVPERIPAEFRWPHEKQRLFPDHPGYADKGVNASLYNADHEGGPRNGVLTAIQDFVAEHDGKLTLSLIEGMDGLGVLIDERLALATPAIPKTLAAFASSEQAKAHLLAVEHQRQVYRLFLDEAERWSHNLYQHFTVTTDHLRREERKVAELYAHTEELHRTIADMERSKSWRWTAWLRRLFR